MGQFLDCEPMAGVNDNNDIRTIEDMNDPFKDGMVIGSLNISDDIENDSGDYIIDGDIVKSETPFGLVIDGKKASIDISDVYGEYDTEVAITFKAILGAGIVKLLNFKSSHDVSITVDENNNVSINDTILGKVNPYRDVMSVYTINLIGYLGGENIIEVYENDTLVGKLKSNGYDEASDVSLISEKSEHGIESIGDIKIFYRTLLSNEIVGLMNGSYNFQPMKMTFRVLNDGDKVKIGFTKMSYCVIDWGDGNSDTVYNTGLKEHTYSKSGDYNVTLDGVFGVYLGNTKPLSFNAFGRKPLLSCVAMFRGTPDTSFSKLNDIPDLSRVYDMRGMLSFTNFNKDVTKWDVSNVTDMGNLFQKAYKFDQDISNWDVSNVEWMNFMFDGAVKFNIDLTKWNVSKVKDMTSMFMGAKSITGIDFSPWDVSNVEDHEDFLHNAGDGNTEPNWA